MRLPILRSVPLLRSYMLSCSNVSICLTISIVGAFLWSSREMEYGAGLWSQPRGENLLDGGAPFYDTYQTKDGKYMAVGALEPQFFHTLLQSKCG